MSPDLPNRADIESQIAFEAQYGAKPPQEQTMMRTCTIDREALLDALMCLTHIAGCPHHYGHCVAGPFDQPASRGRVLCPMGLSSTGGYWENDRGEENLDPMVFLDADPGLDYTWGDLDRIRADLDLDDDAEVSAEQEAPFTATARGWITENLVPTITLEDGRTLTVIYRSEAEPVRR